MLPPAGCVRGSRTVSSEEHPQLGALEVRGVGGPGGREGLPGESTLSGEGRGSPATKMSGTVPGGGPNDRAMRGEALMKRGWRRGKGAHHEA